MEPKTKPLAQEAAATETETAEIEAGREDRAQ
jgi:hypothetical protein